MENLADLFEDMLQDVYYAEKKLTKELPKMAKKASCDELREAFESHLEETETHVERIEQVFASIDKPAKAKKCEAIEGIAAEVKEAIEESESDEVLDAVLIAHGQAAEHYEIARYGALIAWAKQLGYDEAAELLEMTLEEEKAADTKLNDIAEESVNEAADMAEDEDDQEDEKPSSSKRKKAA